MAIAILHVVERIGFQTAVALHDICAYQYVAHFTAISPGIHADSAADRAGDAAQKFCSGQRIVACETGSRYTGRPCAADDHFRVFAVHHDCGESLAQPYGHAALTAIADDEVGTKAKRPDIYNRRQVRQKVLQVTNIFGLEQPLRRSATFEPDQRSQRDRKSTCLNSSHVRISYAV